MITYTVRSGDNLTKIAYQYQTTIAIIMGDNPVIKNKDQIQVGWKLKIRTAEEYAKDKAAKASQAKSKASQTKSSASSSSGGSTGVLWDGVSINTGQIGRVTITANTTLWKMDSKDKLQAVRTLKKNERFRVYHTTTKHGGMYNLGGNNWIYKKNVIYEAVPLHLSPGGKPNQTKDAVGTITPDKSSGTKQVINLSPKLAVFENPYYRRPVFQAKRSDGKTVTMELRVLSVGNAYSNQIVQNKTNSGYFINLAGYNLPMMTINGAFIDSKANREFDDFLDRYLEFIQAYKSGKYYSFSICTFYYKNREYKGLVAGFSYTDRQEEPFHKNFSMQFLVLKEKRLTGSAIKSIPLVGNRAGKTEEQYLSDIGSMLANPITGKYGTS